LCYYTSEVSCPYFYPVHAKSQDTAPPGVLPLGGLWSGFCRAVPGQASPLEDARRVCHLGYARGECSRFPVEDPGADAVRFTIARDTGRSVSLYYVLERNHHPWAHGSLEYSRATACFVQPPPGEIVSRQAEAYVESYLRRTKETVAR
jgi:hypothetical protein